MAVILVTGGAGYIGSHTCKALVAAGHRPVVFDNLSTGWRAAVRWGPLVEGDLLDRAALDAAFAEHRPDAVMHFAAFSHVGDSVARPDLYWRNNVGGSVNLAMAAREHGATAFVFSSSCAIYGEARDDVLTEDDPLVPVSPYGATKLAVEQMLSDFGAAFGLRSVAFRYFNAAGADADREIGEDHRPETHLIPIILDAASGRRPAITVNGTDYPTPDGTCIRDYIHVHDLADAHVRGLEWLLDGGAPLALNLGSGAGHSVRAVISAAEQVVGCRIPVIEGPRRPGDPARLISGSDMAGRVLGWKPARSGLERIVSDAWGWHQTGGYPG